MQQYILKRNKDNISKAISLKDRTKPMTIVDRRPSFLSQAKHIENLSSLQCKLPNGVVNSKKQTTVWLGDKPGDKKEDGIMGNCIMIKDGNDKAETIKNISEKAGAIGCECGIWEQDYKTEGTNNTNPFQVPICGMYKEYRRTELQHVIILYYHFGPYHHGYIVAVQEHYRNPRAFGAVTGVSKGEMNNPDQTSSSYYSSTHERTQDKSIIGNTENATSKVKFDAYTKLGGEGARFMCIRNNIGKVTDNTVIYTPGSQYGIKFSELWRTWSATFNGKFNIGDDEIIEKMRYYGGTLQMNEDIVRTPPTSGASRTQTISRNVRNATPVSVGSDKIELSPNSSQNMERVRITKDQITSALVEQFHLEVGPSTRLSNAVKKNEDESYDKFIHEILNLKISRTSKKQVFESKDQNRVLEIIFSTIWK